MWNKSISWCLSHINQPTYLLRAGLLVNGAWSVQIFLLIHTRPLFHRRKRYYGLWTHILVKNILMMDLFQLLSSQDVNWWTGVVWITCGLLWCFYQLFGLSFWRHPFTAEHPLLSKWCNDTFLQIWWRNKLIYILDGLMVSTFTANVHFGWTIHLNLVGRVIFSIIEIL